MTFLAICILLVQTVWLIVLGIRDILSPSREALTLRGVFLLGFVLFQPGSALFTLFTGEIDRVMAADVGWASVVFAILSSLFIVLTLLFYNRGWFVSRLAARETVNREVSSGGLVFAAFLSLLIGVLLRDVLGLVPILGVLTEMLSTGAFCVALGCAGWAWARSPFHVGTILPFVVVGASTAALLLNNAFSRRGLVAAVIATIWAAYFARWRGGQRTTLVIRATVFICIGYTLVLLQSATRGSSHQGGNVAEYIQAFFEVDGSDLAEAALGMASGQFAGANSMWLIEECPSTFPRWPLHSLEYYATQPIPRVLWSGKPWSVGNEMVLVAGISGVKKDEFSFGPGLVGHLVVDIPWIALPLYAMIIGLALRYMDDRVAHNPSNPFVVLQFGAATSQFLALPRGELGLFAFNATAWIAGSWLALSLARTLVTSRNRLVDPDELSPLADDIQPESSWETNEPHALDRTHVPVA
jgi:hypothetical protein